MRISFLGYSKLIVSTTGQHSGAIFLFPIFSRLFQALSVTLVWQRDRILNFPLHFYFLTCVALSCLRCTYRLDIYERWNYLINRVFMIYSAGLKEDCTCSLLFKSKILTRNTRLGEVPKILLYFQSEYINTITILL